MRILLIEDEPDLLQSLAKSLREEGYAVDAAEDGREGLLKALAADYDAVVMDVMLPYLSGWEVLQELRAQKSTPVLLLTSRDATQDRVRGLDAGADDYLVKPFDLSELFARIRALIRRGARTVKPVLEFGEVLVDTAKRTVSRGGASVELTAREYALVEFLAVHNGELVTRTQLYEHLFDENEESFSNLLDVYVSQVRRKLGHGFILTRRGQGYCVEV